MIWFHIWGWVREQPFNTIFLILQLTGAIHLLESSIGCQTQLPHADYSYSVLNEARVQGMKERECPLSEVFALQDCTLDIWPGALLLKKRKEGDSPKETVIVELPAGKLLLFRGDLVHAGSQYHSLNHRLHFYLDSSFCNRAHNNTQYVTNDGVLCSIKLLMVH